MTAGAAGYALLAAGCRDRERAAEQQTETWPPLLPTGAFAPTAADEAFLDAVEEQGSLYFWEQGNPENGQVLDHALSRSEGGLDPSTRESSIAATGFGLTAMCIADRRGYRAHAEIVARVRTTLDFHLNRMPEKHGFLYHFNDVSTGQPLPRSGVSSMDTAILLCGALTARAYFADSRIASLATQLYDRVQWAWMLNGESTFVLEWNPEWGFSHRRYDTYCELMMLYLLAIGSRTHPIAADYWDRFRRPVMHYEGYSYFSSSTDPLFTHQYSHAWFDFRGKRDAYANYFNNSIAATEAHETFCLGYPAPEKPWYSRDYWGITSSDSRQGYTVWGGPPAQGPIDGSVVPCAAGGSLVFLPNECVSMLRTLRSKWGAAGAWGRYGFVDAFHPAANWYCPYVLGIDQGITVLMAENLRTGLIWKAFMSNPECRGAMQAVGFLNEG